MIEYLGLDNQFCLEIIPPGIIIHYMLLSGILNGGQETIILQQHYSTTQSEKHVFAYQHENINEKTKLVTLVTPMICPFVKSVFIDFFLFNLSLAQLVLIFLTSGSLVHYCLFLFKMSRISYHEDKSSVLHKNKYFMRINC